MAWQAVEAEISVMFREYSGGWYRRLIAEWFAYHRRLESNREGYALDTRRQIKARAAAKRWREANH